jgi:hypothetical protein
MTTDPRERLKQKLVDGGYGGLYCPDEPCGCELDDLAPCGQDIGGDEGIDGYCQPGYKFDCIDKKCARPCDGQMAGSWCITRSPDGPKEITEPEPTTDPYALPVDHCKDCCCAQSWAALGISEYNGKSIVENIIDLKAQLAAVTAEREDFAGALRMVGRWNNCSAGELVRRYRA